MATGPFTYPQGFVHLGPFLSLILLFLTCLISYISATFLIEAISVTSTLKDKEYALNGRGESESSTEPVEHPSMMKYHSDDSMIVTSVNQSVVNGRQNPFYIKHKVELGTLAERLTHPPFKTITMAIFIIYCYGGICLKYVSGAESMNAAISYLIWSDSEELKRRLGFDPYFISVFIFGFFSCYFSFGNIENAKTLQVVTTFLRFIRFRQPGQVLGLGLRKHHLRFHLPPFGERYHLSGKAPETDSKNVPDQ
jgi:hypothetical protein